MGTTLAAVMALGTCSLAARNITTSGFLRLPMRWLLNTLSSLHQIDLATRYADRIIGLRAGRVVVDSPVESFGAAGYAPSSAPRLPSPRSPPRAEAHDMCRLPLPGAPGCGSPSCVVADPP